MNTDSKPNPPIANPPPAPDPIPLGYAPGQRRLRRAIKRPLIIAALILLSLASWRYGPHAIVYARQRYWQRQCMNFTPSTETVVYERRPPGSAPLIASPYMDGHSPELAALRGIGLKQAIDQMLKPPVIVCKAPIGWVRFLQATQNTTSDDYAVAVLFCHQLISPGGHQRLVTIELPELADVGDLLTAEMGQRVYSSVGWDGCPPPTTDQRAVQYSGQYLPMPRRIFAGQPDPNDAGHFTIAYEWPDGTRGIMDGRLRDNDQVILSIRPGPGDIPSAWRLRRAHPELWDDH